MNRIELKKNDQLIFGLSTENNCENEEQLLLLLEEIVLMLKSPKVEDKEIF